MHETILPFREKVILLVSKIPVGRVMSYGDIALYCGSPRAARQVGSIAHNGPDSVPWHRVVNRFGGLASGYHGGRVAQAAALEQEGVCIRDFVVIRFEEYRWLPGHLS